jgi:hypothetical protein
MPPGVVIMYTVREPRRAHIKYILKGLEKGAMFGTESEQVLGGVKTCITLSLDNVYAS